jgi:hypothetical protein
MTISPNRSNPFYGTDSVAGSLRASLSTTATMRRDDAPASATQRAIPLDVKALYPALYPVAPAMRLGWSLRRLILQR